jgi:hypothetical protein
VWYNMAWEKRRGGLYYYRSVRGIFGVKKFYMGSQKTGEAAAKADTLAREKRRDEQETVAKDLQVFVKGTDATERHLVALDDACDLLVGAELEKAGFHRHHNEWRRRQNGEAKGKG